MLRKLGIRGDTMVEVLLASVILSIVLAGAYGLSSRATRLNQSSYERTKASNLIQEQIEYLRAAQNEDGNAWRDITNPALGVEAYWECRDTSTEVYPENQDYEFFLSGDGDDVILENTNPQGENYKTDGLFYTWIAKQNDGSSGYIDFYIYTCWEGLGGIGDQATGTVMRLENR